ncbi:hypothetical protein HYFRA_00010721 [Hymenoscyphus fraxineus]|uniref:Uncharacterized protein n=1 Tax=Hymenoscyphus fraxineus TaxID=746836 RepID=A0A9N9L347_9HELO|nr:hypothetical protein HYFRA_00010721 [Hymenoscyphus fraxineus]
MATEILRLILLRYSIMPTSTEDKGIIRHSHGRTRHNITLLSHFNGLPVTSPPSNSNKDITEVFPHTLIAELSKPGIFQSVYEGHAIHSAKISGKCGDDPAYQIAYLWLMKLEEEEETQPPFDSCYKVPVVGDDNGNIYEVGNSEATNIRLKLMPGQAPGGGKRWKANIPPEAEIEADLDGMTEVELEVEPEWEPAEKPPEEEEEVSEEE